MKRPVFAGCRITYLDIYKSVHPAFYCMIHGANQGGIQILIREFNFFFNLEKMDF